MAASIEEGKRAWQMVLDGIRAQIRKLVPGSHEHKTKSDHLERLIKMNTIKPREPGAGISQQPGQHPESSISKPEPVKSIVKNENLFSTSIDTLVNQFRTEQQPVITQDMLCEADQVIKKFRADQDPPFTADLLCEADQVIKKFNSELEAENIDASKFETSVDREAALIRAGL